MLLASSTFFGCATSYVSSAKADISEPLTTSTVIDEGHGITASMGARISKTDADHVVTHTDRDNSLLENTVASPPDNYSVNWNSTTLGFDGRLVFNVDDTSDGIHKLSDIFFSYNSDAFDSLKTYSGLIGIGVTYTTPWIDLRLAPALGVHHYSISATEVTTPPCTDDETDEGEKPCPSNVIQNFESSGSSLIFTGSITIWPSFGNNGNWKLVPFVGYDYTRMGLSAGDITATSLSLSQSTFSLGVQYSGEYENLKARISKNGLSDVDETGNYFKAELSIEIKDRIFRSL